MTFFANCACIELPVFMVFFTIMFSSSIESNFIIYRTCYVIMDYNETDCAKLGLNTTDNATRELENEVEPYANYISMTNSLVTSIMPCILCLFIGPYSDKKGRKMILILTHVGLTLSYGIKIVIAAISWINPWFTFVQCIPTLLTGGVPTFILVAYCYLIDVTNEENRGLRLGIMEGTVALAMLLGGYLGPYGLIYLDYLGVFIICTSSMFFSLVVITCFLKETVTVEENNNTALFSTSHIKQMVDASFRQRNRYNRIVTIGCIISITSYVMAVNNTGVENLLYRSKFHWNIRNITNFSTIRAILAIIGSFFCIYILHKLLKIGECYLLIVALSLSAISTFLIATAQKDAQIYAGGGLCFMAGIVTPLVRSLMSKVIPRDDVGKVFSLSICFESLITIISGPLYTVIYNNTLTTFPGAFDLIPCALHVINVLFYIWIIFLGKYENSQAYVNIPEEESQSTIN